MMPKSLKIEEFVRGSGKKVILLTASFVIPVAVMTAILIIRKIHPFGTFSIIDGDLYSRYVPLLTELRRKLLEGDSLFYSWNIGYGVNFFAFFGTYLSSPLNLLAVFFPESGISDAIALQMLLRVGLSGLGFAFFVYEKDSCDNAFLPALSSAYALGGYMLAYILDISLADFIVLMPFVLLGAWRLIRGEKAVMFTVALFFLTLSAWRTGLYAGMFLILFLPLMYFEAGGKRMPGRSRVFMPLRFFICALIAFGAAAVILFPSLLAYRGAVTESGGFRFPEDLKMYFPFFTLGDRMMFRTVPELGQRVPNIYCGVAAMIMVPLFALNPRIPFRERLYAMILLGFLYITLSGSLIDYALNGLVLTREQHFRQALLIVILLLYMTSRAIRHVAEIPRKTIFYSMLGVFVFLVLNHETGETVRAWQSTYGTALLVFAYGFCVRALDGNPKRARLLAMIFLLITVTELSITVHYTGKARIKIIEQTEYSSNGQYGQKVRAAFPGIDNSPIIRVASDMVFTEYDGAWSGIPVPDSDAFLMSENLLEFSSRNGFGSRAHSKLYSAGSNDVTGMLFGIGGKLLFTQAESETVVDDRVGDYIEEDFESETPPPFGVGAYYDFDTVKKQKNTADSIAQYDISFIRNEHALSIAYRVNREVNNFFGLPSESPFENINALLERMGAEALYVEQNMNIEEMSLVYETKVGRFAFTELTGNASLETTISDLTLGDRLFLYIDTDLETQVSVRMLRSVNQKNFNVYSIEGGQIIDCGTISDESAFVRISVSSPRTEEESFSVFASTLDPERIDVVYEMFAEESLRTDRIDGSGISGSVDTEGDGSLFFSVPFDNGWSVRVDGRSARIERAAGAWLSIPIRPGAHQITASYTPPGFMTGALISVISVIFFILLLYFNPGHIMGLSRTEEERIETRRSQDESRDKIREGES